MPGTYTGGVQHTRTAGRRAAWPPHPREAGPAHGAIRPRTKRIMLTPRSQVHPDAHALTRVNNVIAVVNKANRLVRRFAQVAGGSVSGKRNGRTS